MTSELKVAIEATQAAQEILLKYYTKIDKHELKDDNSPVTVADKESEDVIKQVIRQSFPDHNILGEESGKEHKNSEYTWIIDPIDGTKNYLRAIPLFSTLIALKKRNEWLVGVSNAPVLHELAYAQKGEGAYLNEQRISVSDTATLEDSYLTFGSIKYFDKYGCLEQLVDLSKKVKMARGTGDFWAYHLVASGKYDIKVEAEAKIWDVAAHKVIIEEAGGVMTTLDGSELPEEGVCSTLATNKTLHPLVVDFFK